MWYFIVLLVILAIFVVDLVVAANPYSYIYKYDSAPTEPKVDCILVLGCGIKDAETPSDMLRDRLDAAFAAYLKGCSDKIIVSGDNGQKEYNEIHVMLHYLLNKGVPASDIFCDHAGFSTYDSIYRAKTIFGVKTTLIVSQKYHLYRALYLAQGMGIEANGIDADLHEYKGQMKREIREVLARDKDCIKLKLHGKSKYGGTPISLQGDSTLSWEASELEF